MTDRSLPDLLDQVEALLDGARRVPVTITFTGGDLPAGTNVKLHDGILAALDLLQPLLEVARAARFGLVPHPKHEDYYVEKPVQSDLREGEQGL